MKKLSTTVLNKNNEEKIISVWVDELTEKALEAVDEATRHQYIIDEYRVYLSNRKETRRHQSLDYSMDNGFDVADENPSPEECCEKQELSEKINDALELLTDKQQLIFVAVVLEKKSLSVIARETGISQQAVSIHFFRARKKLKKFFQNRL